PSDDCSFWYTQEYYAASGPVAWKTRIGKFTVTPCAVNTAPVANDDSATVSQDISPSVTVNVLANDTDAEDNLQANGTVTITVPPPVGSAVVNPDKTITYTAPEDFFGTTSLTYKVCDNSL